MTNETQDQQSTDQIDASVKEETSVENTQTEQVTEVQSSVKSEETTQVLPPVEEKQVEAPVVKTPVEPIPVAPVKTEVRIEKSATPVKKQNFTNIDDYLDDIKANGTVVQKNLIAALDKYLEDMKPRKPVTETKGAETQYLFWKTLQAAIENSTQEEFKSLWTIVLAYFQLFKDDAFNERYIYRFAEYWAANTDELSAFQRLINLIKLTADPKERAIGLKQVNVEKSLELIFSEQGRQKLLNFYQ